MLEAMLQEDIRKDLEKMSRKHADLTIHVQDLHYLSVYQVVLLMQAVTHNANVGR